MIDDVYNRHILELAGNIPRLGRLDHPQGSATAHSRLCGSSVTVEVAMEGGRVVDFAHEVKACALGTASASVLARSVIGATVEEIRAAREAVRVMLKENGAPPEGRFADMKYLEPVRDYKARHASTLLPFDATLAAIEKAEGQGA